MSDLDDFPVARGKVESYLNERQLLDYRAEREACLEWLLARSLLIRTYPWGWRREVVAQVEALRMIPLIHRLCERYYASFATTGFLILEFFTGSFQYIGWFSKIISDGHQPGLA